MHRFVKTTKLKDYKRVTDYTNCLFTNNILVTYWRVDAPIGVVWSNRHHWQRQFLEIKEPLVSRIYTTSHV